MTALVPSRELQILAEEADSALRAYAEALRGWNAPDDQHTRYQLRALIEITLEEIGLPDSNWCKRP